MEGIKALEFTPSYVEQQLTASSVERLCCKMSSILPSIKEGHWKKKCYKEFIFGWVCGELYDRLFVVTVKKQSEKCKEMIFKNFLKLSKKLERGRSKAENW